MNVLGLLGGGLQQTKLKLVGLQRRTEIKIVFQQQCHLMLTTTLEIPSNTSELRSGQSVRYLGIGVERSNNLVSNLRKCKSGNIEIPLT